MKDVLKNDHRHVPCDFGIKKFNLTKRTQAFVDEVNVLEAAARTQQDNKKPSKPGGVYVTATSTGLTLYWTASTDNVAVAGYKVTLNGGSPITVTSGLSYAFTSLSANTSYTLTVAAYDTSGNASVAASIIGTTSVDPNVTTTSTSTTSTTTSAGTTTSTSTTSTTTIAGGDTTAPTVPIITSVVASQTSLVVTWGASSDNVGVSGYITEAVGIGIFGTSSTTYTFTGLTAGTTYSIRVYAYDVAGNRSDNAWVTATTLTSSPPVSSSSVIFCDFNGHTVSGTYWNTNGNIVCAPSGLTLSEQDAVLAGMQYDYSPYDVTITSDEAVYNAANPAKRMRVIFTTSWEWYGQVGGVAYIGSFTWGTNTPCFVFTSLLGYNTRYIYTAGSHEAGHTLSLRHQVLCSGSSIVNEYNPGDAVNGAPTMGNSYYNTPKWWIGPNSLGCSIIQNDNTTLTQVLGPHP